MKDKTYFGGKMAELYEIYLDINGDGTAYAEIDGNKVELSISDAVIVNPKYQELFEEDLYQLLGDTMTEKINFYEMHTSDGSLVMNGTFGFDENIEFSVEYDIENREIGNFTAASLIEDTYYSTSQDILDPMFKEAAEQELYNFSSEVSYDERYNDHVDMYAYIGKDCLDEILEVRYESSDKEFYVLNGLGGINKLPEGELTKPFMDVLNKHCQYALDYPETVSDITDLRFNTSSTGVGKATLHSGKEVSFDFDLNRSDPVENFEGSSCAKESLNKILKDEIKIVEQNERINSIKSQYNIKNKNVSIEI